VINALLVVDGAGHGMLEWDWLDLVLCPTGVNRNTAMITQI